MKKQKRREGRLSKTTDDRQPNHLFFFDTETISNYITPTQKEQILRLGVVRYNYIDKDLNVKVDKELTFYSTDELMEFIFHFLAKKKVGYIFAHNVGFDLMVTSLPMWFKNKGLDIKPYIRNGMVFIWSVKTPNGTLKFINTANYTPYKLSKIAKDLGMEKLSVQFDTDNESELIKYCRQDVSIIRELITQYIRFLDDNKLGSFKMTLASQALNAYKRRFNSNLPYTHTDNEVLELEERSYKGGRTECFKIGEFNSQTYYYTDINSMYPYVMYGDNQPKRRINSIYNPSLEKVERLSSIRYLLADCTLNTPLPFIGTLFNPKQYTITNSSTTPRHNKLIFPTGEFREVLHHAELIYALERGFIQKIHRLVLYECGDLFSEYIDFFYNLKKTSVESGNSTIALMAKLFLNSLYGKFGQRYKFFKPIADVNPDEFTIDMVYNEVTNKFYSEFVWFNERWANITDGWVSHSMPIIAGAITSKARMLLWEYAEMVNRENLYYTDTDSLVVNEIGLNNIDSYLNPLELGYLKIEKTTDHLTINGLKDYRWGDTRTLKGVPKTAIEIEPNVFQYEQFEGLAQWQRRDMSKPPLIYTTTKTKRTPYDKGVLLPDGNVVPYNLSKIRS